MKHRIFSSICLKLSCWNYQEKVEAEKEKSNGPVVAIGLLLVSRIPRPVGQQAAAGVKGIWQDMRSGFAYIVRWPALLSILVVSGLLNLVLPPAFSLVPILVAKHFAGGAPQLAWINAAYGIGFVAGGILLGGGGFKRCVFTSLLGLAGLGLGSFLIGIASTFAQGVLSIEILAQKSTKCRFKGPRLHKTAQAAHFGWENNAR